ncbi:MAG: hypothetical protein AB7F66_16865 [Bacteriovoracia bacterium]
MNSKNVRQLLRSVLKTLGAVVGVTLLAAGDCDPNSPENRAMMDQFGEGCSLTKSSQVQEALQNLRKVENFVDKVTGACRDSLQRMSTQLDSAMKDSAAFQNSRQSVSDLNLQIRELRASINSLPANDPLRGQLESEIEYRRRQLIMSDMQVDREEAAFRQAAAGRLIGVMNSLSSDTGALASCRADNPEVITTLTTTGLIMASQFNPMIAASGATLAAVAQLIQAVGITMRKMDFKEVYKKVGAARAPMALGCAVETLTGSYCRAKAMRDQVRSLQQSGVCAAENTELREYVWMAKNFRPLMGQLAQVAGTSTAVGRDQIAPIVTAPPNETQLERMYDGLERLSNYVESASTEIDAQAGLGSFKQNLRRGTVSMARQRVAALKSAMDKYAAAGATAEAWQEMVATIQSEYVGFKAADNGKGQVDRRLDSVLQEVSGFYTDAIRTKLAAENEAVRGQDDQAQQLLEAKMASFQAASALMLNQNLDEAVLTEILGQANPAGAAIQSGAELQLADAVEINISAVEAFSSSLDQLKDFNLADLVKHQRNRFVNWSGADAQELRRGSDLRARRLCGYALGLFPDDDRGRSTVRNKEDLVRQCGNETFRGQRFADLIDRPWTERACLPEQERTMHTLLERR